MVKAGDVLGAQKIILAEVESQVGGAAAASATAGEKVGVAFGNIKESIGTALLPLLDKFGNWFLEKGLPAVERFGGWIMNNLWPALKDGYETIMPGLKKALDIVTGGVGDGSFSFETLGKVITEKVIPFIAKLVNAWLPAAATQLRATIEVVKALWKSFETWRDVVAGVISFILRKFAALSEMWSGVLRALGKVPGFGWATEAADKLDTAAGKANKLADAIDSIKSKTVTVKVNYSTPSRILVNGELINPGMRAGGGPVTANKPYWVGDNPDGTLNRTSELFVPKTSGTIFNQSQLAAGGAGASRVTESPINIYGDVKTTDPLAFEREMQERKRLQSLGRRRA